MSELLSIWNSNDLAGGTTPAPFAIPNNPNARTLKINNQSRFWLLLTRTQSNINVDRIEPFSFLIIPFESDLSLSIDTSINVPSSLTPDNEFVDYSAITGGTVGYLKGSTMFSGDLNSLISNDQLTVSQIYNTSKTFDIPQGTTNTNLKIAFLPNGKLANVHHIDVYISSPNNYSYSVAWGNAYAIFSDGTSKNASATYSVTNNGFNSYSLDGNGVICNNISISLNASPATALEETITVYYAIDTNETSIETVDGVVSRPYEATLKDSSGSITNANTWQQALVGVSSRRYLLVQNLSSYDMWALLWGTSNQPSPGAPGSIYLSPNGGSFVMENTTVSTDYLFMAASNAGAKFTVRFI